MGCLGKVKGINHGSERAHLGALGSPSMQTLKKCIIAGLLGHA